MNALLIPISNADRNRLPLPTGDYVKDEQALAAALTSDMIPSAPKGYKFVQWQINPPDEVFVLFEKT